MIPRQLFFSTTDVSHLLRTGPCLSTMLDDVGDDGDGDDDDEGDDLRDIKTDPNC